MTIPAISWDETSPAGNTDRNLGDNRIRELKAQIREVVAIDHNFASSGQDADNGKHKKISLIEQADLGTGASGKPLLGGQTVSGKPELVYTDEDNNDVQITSAGKIKAENLAGVYPAANLAALATIMGYIYPVGSVVTLGVSTNPATLFGIGTWTAIAGKVIVGIDAGQTEFDALDETGGSKTHTLSISEMPLHGHPFRLSENPGAGADATGGLMVNSGGTVNSYSAHTGSVSDTAGEQIGGTGGGGAHNNLQPYIVKYVWQRTA